MDTIKFYGFWMLVSFWTGEFCFLLTPSAHTCFWTSSRPSTPCSFWGYWILVDDRHGGTNVFHLMFARFDKISVCFYYFSKQHSPFTPASRKLPRSHRFPFLYASTLPPPFIRHHCLSSSALLIATTAVVPFSSINYVWLSVLANQQATRSNV